MSRRLKWIIGSLVTLVVLSYIIGLGSRPQKTTDTVPSSVPTVQVVPARQAAPEPDKAIALFFTNRFASIYLITQEQKEVTVACGSGDEQRCEHDMVNYKVLIKSIMEEEAGTVAPSCMRDSEVEWKTYLRGTDLALEQWIDAYWNMNPNAMEGAVEEMNESKTHLDHATDLLNELKNQNYASCTG